MSENNHIKKYEVKKWLFKSFEMPKIWYNEEEIYNLMQSFKRPRHIDPTTYDFKINFWSNLILKYAQHHHILVINVQQLESVFIKEFKVNGISLKPQCLKTVFEHLINEGKLVEISQFEVGRFLNKFINGMGWILTKPITWSYQKISSMFYTENEAEIKNCYPISGDFVLIDLVKECQTTFIDWFNSMDMRISPRLDIMTEVDFDFLLAQFYPHQPSQSLARKLLTNHRYVEIISLPPSKEINNEYCRPVGVVKFAKSANHPLSSSDIGLDKATIDQIDAMVQLRELSNKLTNDEIDIELKVKKIKEIVKTCLRAGKKEDAKNHLRHGKAVEKILERKRAQLHNVENMLMEVESSTDNIHVFKALSNAAGALKAQSMDVNSVHDTMAEIGDVLAEQEEINASISGLGDSPNNELVAELEQELDNLLLDRNGELQFEDLPRLPEVPGFSPSPVYVTKGTVKAFKYN